MFARALAFNQQIGSWDMSKVTTITASYNDGTNWWNNGNGMFSSADKFNNGQPCGADGGVLWSTLKVVRMAAVFYGADCFNARVNQWDTSIATDMSGTFRSNLVFNQPLNNWNTSNVQYMDEMFASAKLYNQNLSSWNTNSVISKPPVSFADNTTAWTLPKPSW
jgi:surface protein